MNYRNLFKIFILLASVMPVPVVMWAQTYQEMDAEARAAAENFRSKNFNSAYESATKEFKAGDHEKAIATANGFLNYAPDTTDLITLRARARAALFEQENKAVTWRSAQSESLRRHNSQNFIFAREDFLRVLESDPQNKTIRADFGWLLYNAGLPTDALRQFKKALEIDPNYLPAIEGRAKTSYFVGDFNGCIEGINNYLKHPEFRSKDSGWAYLRLGECYAELEDQPNAKANFKKAVSIQSDLQRSWIYLAFTKDGYKCKEEDYAKIGQKSGFERYLADKRWLRCESRNKRNWITEAFDSEENLKYYGLASANITRLEDKYHEIYDVLPSKQKQEVLSLEHTKRAVKFRESELNAAALEAANRAIFLNPKNIEAHSMRADLIFLHPDLTVKLLAWNVQNEMPPTAEAEFEKRMIRGRIYRQVKGNQRAAIAEFDRAIPAFNPGVYPSADKYVMPNYLADAYYRKGLALWDDNQPVAAYDAFVAAENISKGYVGEEFFTKLVQQHPELGVANQARKLAHTADVFSFGLQLNELIREANSIVEKYNKRNEQAQSTQEKCRPIQSERNALSNVQSKINQLEAKLPKDAETIKRYYKQVEALQKLIKDHREKTKVCGF